MAASSALVMFDSRQNKSGTRSTMITAPAALKDCERLCGFQRFLAGENRDIGISGDFQKKDWPHALQIKRTEKTRRRGLMRRE